MPRNKRKAQQLIARRARKAAKRRDLAKNHRSGKTTRSRAARAESFDLGAFTRLLR